MVSKIRPPADELRGAAARTERVNLFGDVVKLFFSTPVTSDFAGRRTGQMTTCYPQLDAYPLLALRNGFGKSQ